VKKISAHITKKVADKLAEMFKKDRTDFESKWPDLQVFVQYGILSDEKFADKAKNFALLKNTEGKFQTVEEYKNSISALQTDKDGNVVVLYCNNIDEHFAQIKKAKERGYDLVELDGPLASHWIGKMEQENEKLKFARIDSDSIDKLISKDDNVPSKLSKEDEEKLKPIFESSVNKEKYTIQFESMLETDSPVIITQPEFIRRMMEQQRLGGNSFYGGLPEMYNVVINANHPKILQLLERDEEVSTQQAKYLTDLALLSNGLLKGQALNEFIERSVEQIG
jgi:molecular chaperone HtpG